MLAVAAELLISANLLTLAGVPYVADGGAMPLKLHPGTYLLWIADLAALWSGRMTWLGGLDNCLWAFFVATLACMAFVLLLTGAGNLVVLLDTFLPAGLLAAAWSGASAPARLALRRMMQILLAGNAALALAEMAAGATLVPLYLNGAGYIPLTEDFRPTALFDHPLTGALMMMMALALPPAGRVGVAYRVLIWAGMVAFGGRVALGITTAGLLGRFGVRRLRLLLARDPRWAWGLVAAGVGLVTVLILGMGALGLGLGGRVAGHLYWDDSAQVRLAQWQILGQLDTWQVVLGTPRDALLAQINALRLGTGVEVIENFWLLMFASLGLVGFPMFLAAIGALSGWCWRVGGVRGRALLVEVLLVASASNSLGRKSTVLVCLVATVCAVERRGRAGPVRLAAIIAPRMALVAAGA
jgi:hypothetical protein